MTYNEVINIARRLDKETQAKIDKEVEERLEILREGDLNQEDMEKMEDCLYMSLVIQEYLDGEYELLEEEKMLLLAEMEELYNEYGELLTKAKLEEKVSKKKRMALELMRIREQLFDRKDRMRDVNKDIRTNRENNEKLENLSSKDNMEKIAKDNIDNKNLNNQKETSKKALDVNGEELKPFNPKGMIDTDTRRDTNVKSGLKNETNTIGNNTQNNGGNKPVIKERDRTETIKKQIGETNSNHTSGERINPDVTKKEVIDILDEINTNNGLGMGNDLFGGDPNFKNDLDKEYNRK